VTCARDAWCRFVSEKSEELARKSRLDSLERYYAKFCGGTSEMMTRHQFADAFKRTVYMKGVDASLGRLRPDEELVIASRIWVILAGESAATVDFETFGRFILEAPGLAGVQVRAARHRRALVRFDSLCTRSCAQATPSTCCSTNWCRSSQGVSFSTSGLRSSSACPRPLRPLLKTFIRFNRVLKNTLEDATEAPPAKVMATAMFGRAVVTQRLARARVKSTTACSDKPSTFSRRRR
jgi:hypothetical protein